MEWRQCSSDFTWAFMWFSQNDEYPLPKFIWTSLVEKTKKMVDDISGVLWKYYKLINLCLKFPECKYIRSSCATNTRSSFECLGDGLAFLMWWQCGEVMQCWIVNGVLLCIECQAIFTRPSIPFGVVTWILVQVWRLKRCPAFSPAFASANRFLT